MDDSELKSLLAKIEIPEVDEAAKARALNDSQSAFEATSKINAKNSQGISRQPRLMDVITTHIHKLIGEITMKKSYMILGTVALSAIAISLLNSTSLQKPDFVTVQKQELAMVDANLAASAPPPPASPQSPQHDAMMVRSFAKSSSMTMDAASGARNAGTAGVMALGDSIGEGMPYEPYPAARAEYFGNDKFENIKQNPVKLVKEDPVSTFSIDVDTASYSFVRKALNNGSLAPKDAVRVEELINYFDYDYAVPESKAEPFKPTIALYQTPWNPDTMLLHIGIKGHELAKDAPKPHSNLTFLLDVSGSMNHPDKLPLLKNAFRMLVDSLQPDDTVAIVVYAGAAGVVLEPTKLSEKNKILSALENLQPGGSTAGGEGIRQAYSLAESSFSKDGVNRVILATDGDFNVGITDGEKLEDLVSRKRDSGVYLSVLGFGRGNYNDALMQKLAQNGNGNAAYIDNLNEARKVLVQEATSTLYPIANDVKIQVEFNPLAVAEYRLIGYETRLLNREDFNNDKVDAGDIGAGHTVTAIYELTPTGSKAKLIDDLRYGKDQPAPAAKSDGNEIGFLKLRYKLPGEKESKLIERPISLSDKAANISSLSDDVRFAGAVAAFGQLLRDEMYTKSYTFDDVLQLAGSARGKDEYGYRSEFLNLVRLAKTAQDQEAQPNNGDPANPSPEQPVY